MSFVPDRWLECPRKGQLLAGKFLPFKTPLSSKYNDLVPEENRFDLDMLFAYLEASKQQMGLIIDLTNTERFYDRKTVEQRGIKHVKLQCRGHGESPSPQQTQVFIDICSTFIDHNPLKTIGVHCTHGFNRTGFLIAAYLVEKMDWGIDAAVRAFAVIRPPGIYKGHYLVELFSRYGEKEDAPPPPELPEWCLGYEEDVNPDSDTPDSSSGSSHRGRRAEIMKPNAKFLEGVTVKGVEQVKTQPKLLQLQRKCQDMCNWPKSGFPGSQPVSMDQVNIKMLWKKPYKVSWKADGVRYMMLIDGKNECYMFDRDHSVFSVPGLHFPKRKEPFAYLKNTLVDGEMIIDKINGQPFPRYYIYDIIKFEGQEVGSMDLNIRLDCVQKEIIGPRHEAMKQGRIDKRHEPFSVRSKPFWDIAIANKLLKGKFLEQCSHETDGLIFQPVPEKYIPGKCPSVLKWKPPELNSVDFRLKIVREQREGMLPHTKGYLYVGGRDLPFQEIKLTTELKTHNNKIIECTYEDNQWKFLRVRTDKSMPNAFTTAEGVCKSIAFPVTEEFLLSFIQKNGWQPGRHKPPSGDNSTAASLKRPLNPKEEDNPNKKAKDQKLMPPPPLPSV